jgi:hypothetical protein
MLVRNYHYSLHNKPKEHNSLTKHQHSPEAMQVVFFDCVFRVIFTLLHSHIDDDNKKIIIMIRQIKIVHSFKHEHFCNCKLISFFRVSLSLEVNIRAGKPKKKSISFLFCARMSFL